MPRIVDKEEKKQEILHAAMHIFARRGIVKAKMIDIAQEAGIGKGTIYEYFRSKEEIFNTAFQYLFQMTEQAILTAVSLTDDPVEKLELVVKTSFESFLHGDGEFAEIMMDFWAEGVRNKDNDIVDIINLKTIYSKYRRIISEIIADGITKGCFREVDIGAMSSALIGSLDGIYLQWIVDRSAIDMNKISTTLMDGFLNGLKK